MKTLIIDIETVGERFEAIDPQTQENLTKWIKKQATTEEEYNALFEDVKNELGLSPLTGEIVAIGMLDAETLQGTVLFQAPGQQLGQFTEENITYVQTDERTMIQRFWETVRQAREVVTFNGWGFDIPFINIRSAIHRVKPSANLMINRFLNNQRNTNVRHIDLQDQLSYYAAVKRKGSLHLYCRAFSIKTPKVEGSSGSDVGRMYQEGLYVDIARYNARDIIATKELFDYWNDFLRFE